MPHNSYAHRFFCLLAGFCALTALAAAPTVAEKKQQLLRGGGDMDFEMGALLQEINHQIKEHKQALQELYGQVELQQQQNAPDEVYADLVLKIRQEQGSLKLLENRWKQETLKNRGGEEYGLWYQPESTIGQLVQDYGDPGFVYLIPPEVAILKVSVSSSLPIPAEAWGPMLELVLMQKGVGVRQLNPFLKQLYMTQQPSIGIDGIIELPEQLDLYPETARLGFVLSPEPKQLTSAAQFLSKFMNPDQVSLHVVDRHLFLIGPQRSIKEILKLYAFIDSGKSGRLWRLLPVNKMNADEMAAVLRTLFGVGNTPLPAKGQEGTALGELAILTLPSLPHSLFVMGTREDMDEAAKIIQEVESQVGDVSEKILFTYKVKHSDARELAEVLERVYALMVKEPMISEGETPNAATAPVYELPAQGEYLRGVDDRLLVITNEDPPLNALETLETERLRHFIVEPKSGSIIMVTERVYLDKLKALLKKIDVPKQMVRIEVLLVEQRASADCNYGLNLLRLGSTSSNRHFDGMSWNDLAAGSLNKGILKFIFSRECTEHFPAFDITYNFLLSQENVCINAAPNVTTVNQTPATIHVLEELSINTGIVELDTTKNTTVKDAYVRGQYGVSIEVTPTVHAAQKDFDEDGFCDYITMETNIKFDETVSRINDRPNVIRRQVKNVVRVADGQTLIVGGLRNRQSRDAEDHVPFLGEIPGLGKVFGTNAHHTASSEMFVFITPRIVGESDPIASQMRRQVLCWRPGDSASFEHLLKEAKETQRASEVALGMQQLLSGSLMASREAEVYEGQ